MISSIKRIKRLKSFPHPSQILLILFVFSLVWSSDSYASQRIEQREATFQALITHESNRYQVDPALIKAIIMAESGFNPNAVSRSGARGLMQLMPSTAKSLGVEDCFNPKQNIQAGVRYFKRLKKRFNGNIKLALAAYNAGVMKVKYYGGIPPFKDTESYIQKVLKYYRIYQR